MTQHLKFYITIFVLVIIASVSAFASILSYRTASDYQVYIEILDKRTNEITAKLVQQQEQDRILYHQYDLLKTELNKRDETIRRLTIELHESKKGKDNGLFRKSFRPLRKSS
jgi:hypothetical protein